MPSHLTTARARRFAASSSLRLHSTPSGIGWTQGHSAPPETLGAPSSIGHRAPFITSRRTIPASDRKTDDGRSAASAEWPGRRDLCPSVNTPTAADSGRLLNTDGRIPAQAKWPPCHRTVRRAEPRRRWARRLVSSSPSDDLDGCGRRTHATVAIAHCQQRAAEQVQRGDSRDERHVALE